MVDPELADNRTPWNKWTEGDLDFAHLPAADQITAKAFLAESNVEAEVTSDRLDEATHLEDDEDLAWLIVGQMFTGVTEEWIRPRLRLNPSVGSVDLESESLNVDLNGELIEDLDQEDVFGSGPNDGELARAETPFVGAGVPTTLEGG